jgi:hypothetical protein
MTYISAIKIYDPFPEILAALRILFKSRFTIIPLREHPLDFFLIRLLVPRIIGALLSKSLPLADIKESLPQQEGGRPLPDFSGQIILECI